MKHKGGIAYKIKGKVYTKLKELMDLYGMTYNEAVYMVNKRKVDPNGYSVRVIRELKL